MEVGTLNMPAGCRREFLRRMATSACITEQEAEELTGRVLGTLAEKRLDREHYRPPLTGIFELHNPVVPPKHWQGG